MALPRFRSIPACPTFTSSPPPLSLTSVSFYTKLHVIMVNSSRLIGNLTRDMSAVDQLQQPQILQNKSPPRPNAPPSSQRGSSICDCVDWPHCQEMTDVSSRFGGGLGRFLWNATPSRFIAKHPRSQQCSRFKLLLGARTAPHAATSFPRPYNMDFGQARQPTQRSRRPVSFVLHRVPRFETAASSFQASNACRAT